MADAQALHPTASKVRSGDPGAGIEPPAEAAAIIEIRH
jgi:hypothetical protein